MLPITPANSRLFDTVFRGVSATADEIRVAFPDGVFQFDLIEPFTTTVPVTGGDRSYLAAVIVPEPASVLLLGVGLAGLACARRGRK